MVNILSPPESDYLEYDSFKVIFLFTIFIINIKKKMLILILQENLSLQYKKFEYEEHKFLGLIIYLSKFQRWIVSIHKPDDFEGIVVDFTEDDRTPRKKLENDIIQMCRESFNVYLDPSTYKMFEFD